MNITIALDLAVMLVGLLMYFFATKAELKEVGKWAYAVGLLAFLFHFAGRVGIVGEGR